jgi:4-amino-4-deoxy-L-arabinose transferase-like glycosyltransferase
MNVISFADKLHLRQHLNPYRIITGIGFIVATVLILTTPLQMPDPDDWAYYHGVRNFSQGDLTVDNDAQYEQALDTIRQGNVLLQYLPLEYNKWALEKAPGHVFYLVPFKLLGIPRWGNILLALGMVIVTYILLKRLRNEKTAMIGSLLMLFTPIGMVMLNRVYMDTYASLALLVMGGGLYIYYHLEKEKFTAVKGGTILFLAFFFTGWSVVARYTNLPIAVILFLHLVITRFIAWRKGEKTGIKAEIIPLVLGIGLPVAALLVYNYYVFGSALTYSYAHSPWPTKFAFQYLGQVDADGESIPLQILRYNLEGFARNIFIGFPLLVIGIPGFLAVLYFKFFKRNQPEGKWSGLRSELPWDILLVLIGWFVCVFFLYLTYEWTAGLKMGGGFVLLNRFLLPGLFPVVVICALVMARFPLKILVPVMLIIIVFGCLLYAQWALDLHILPDCLTERTLESRWYGYVFPPWTPYFHPGATGSDYFPFPGWSIKYFYPKP